jgi:hypothetical protein
MQNIKQERYTTVYGSACAPNNCLLIENDAYFSLKHKRDSASRSTRVMSWPKAAACAFTTNLAMAIRILQRNRGTIRRRVALTLRGNLRCISPHLKKSYSYKEASLLALLVVASKGLFLNLVVSSLPANSLIRFVVLSERGTITLLLKPAEHWYPLL